MNSIFNYFWLVLIAANCINTLLFSITARPRLREKPELYNGYRRIIFGTVVFFNIPFVIMGIGLLTGNVSGMDHYSRLEFNNLFVTIFHVSIIVLILLGFYWIFFAKGAEFVVKHRELWGIYKSRIPGTTFAIKLVYLLCLMCAAAVFLIGFSGDFGRPKTKDFHIVEFELSDGYKNIPVDADYQSEQIIRGQISPDKITITYSEINLSPGKEKNELKRYMELTGEDYQRCIKIVKNTTFTEKEANKIIPGDSVFAVMFIDSERNNQQGEPSNRDDWKKFEQEIKQKAGIVK